MNWTAEPSRIFSKPPVFSPIFARCGCTFPAGGCAFILPSWCNVYWSGCHPKDFQLFAVFRLSPSAVQREGPGPAETTTVFIHLSNVNCLITHCSPELVHVRVCACVRL